MDCLFFINPTSGSGQGRRLADQIEQFSIPAPVFKQVVFTDPERLSQQVYSCAKNKDLVVLCGGDGTVSSIVSHLVNLEQIPPIAIIPLGTGNDIARGTMWLKSWMKFGLDGLFYAIKEGRCGSLDVWQLQIERAGSSKHYTLCAYVGIGYDGRVCQEFLRLNQFFIKRKISTSVKRLLYLPAGLRIFYKNLLHPERIRCTICYNDEKGKDVQAGEDRLGQILFCNTGYYAGGSLLYKDFSIDDGLMEFFGLKGYLSYMQLLFEGRLPVRHSSIIPVKSSSFQMEFFSSAYFQVDGEPMGLLEKGSKVKLELFRKVPLLTPFLDKYAKKKLKELRPSPELNELSSSVRPVVT